MKRRWLSDDDRRHELWLSRTLEAFEHCLMHGYTVDHLAEACSLEAIETDQIAGWLRDRLGQASPGGIFA